MQFSLFRLYLALASLIGLVGTVIGYGIIGYTAIESSLISDDEYITGSRSYEILSCESPESIPDVKNPQNILQKIRTPEEIKSCKEAARSRIIIERSYYSKISMISGGVWGTLFLLVFLGHFPFFFKASRRDDAK